MQSPEPVARHRELLEQRQELVGCLSELQLRIQDWEERPEELGIMLENVEQFLRGVLPDWEALLRAEAQERRG